MIRFSFSEWQNVARAALVCIFVFGVVNRSKASQCDIETAKEACSTNSSHVVSVSNITKNMHNLCFITYCDEISRVDRSNICGYEIVGAASLDLNIAYFGWNGFVTGQSEDSPKSVQEHDGRVVFPDISRRCADIEYCEPNHRALRRLKIEYLKLPCDETWSMGREELPPIQFVLSFLKVGLIGDNSVLSFGEAGRSLHFGDLIASSGGSLQSRRRGVSRSDIGVSQIAYLNKRDDRQNRGEDAEDRSEERNRIGRNPLPEGGGYVFGGIILFGGFLAWVVCRCMGVR